MTVAVVYRAQVLFIDASVAFAAEKETMSSRIVRNLENEKTLTPFLTASGIHCMMLAGWLRTS